MPNGITKRITTGTDFEFRPSFSPNGNEIVYVTWNNLEKGAIFKINLYDGIPIRSLPEKTKIAD